MTHWTTMAMAVAAGTLSVLLALGAIRLLEPGLSTALLPRWRARRAVTELRAEPLSFLFRGHQLVDATAPARALLAGVPGSDDWLRLNAWLSRRFEGIPAA
nr:hypothetical protein [Paracoccus sp. (in: a-proteobacteria)]